MRLKEVRVRGIVYMGSPCGIQKKRIYRRDEIHIREKGHSDANHQGESKRMGPN